MNGPRYNEKAASEVVGTIILIGIFCTVIGVLAVHVFNQAPPDKVPAINIRISNQSNVVTITHMGGDALPGKVLTVLVDGKDVTASMFLPENFIIGNTLTFSNPGGTPPGSVQVLFTSPATGTVILASSGTPPPVVVTTLPLPSAPAAAFTGSPLAGRAPLLVAFTDLSMNSPTNWSWNFGDGNTTNATVQNPLHRYAGMGTYTVSLTASNPGGSNTTTKTGYITVYSQYVVAPVANFTGTPLTGVEPLAVAFTDTSTNLPTNWSWDFGDGDTTNSTIQSPVHQYAVAGIYTVQLTASNAGGVNTTTRTDYISIVHALKFIQSVVAGRSSSITDSTGKQWSADQPYTTGGWGYTAGNVYSNTKTVSGTPDPTLYQAERYFPNGGGYLFTVPNGDYVVTLKFAEIYDPITSGSPGWRVFNVYIEGVQALTNFNICSIAGNFTALDRTFYPKVTDGILNISFQNVYENPKISAIDIGGNTQLSPVANFAGTPVSGNAPLVVTFTDTSTYAPTSWLWDFGDGDTTNSTVRSPVHRYNAVGTYNVSLTATNLGGSNRKTRVNYVILNPVVPVANFTATPQSGFVPLNVSFTDTSTGAPQFWLWDFGDGDSTNSTLQNTVHQYANTGIYTINLTVTNAGGSSSIKRTNYIVGTRPVPPVADFTGTPLSGIRPLTVQFSDNSTNVPTSWSWNFGDGSTSTARNPSHTYMTAGVYSVSLTATNVAGNNTVTKAGYVSVGYYLPGINANYYRGQSWTDLAGTRVDSEIRFADTASGEVSDEAGWPNSIVGRQDDFSVMWDGYLNIASANTYTFSLRSDDGSFLWIDEGLLIDNGGLHSPATKTGSVTLQPGYHHIVVKMFENTGNAVANLQYSSPSMSLRQVTDLWHVSTVTPVPVTDFTGTPLSGNVPLTVAFTDASTNTPMSWSWNFGDNDNTNATVQNPVHQYANAGTYMVSLTASNAGGSNTATKVNYILVTPPPMVSFTGTPTSGAYPLVVSFTDTSSNTPTSWLWNFGDNDSTNATVQNPVHRYANAGTYTVSLTATNAGGSGSAAKANYITTSPAITASAGTGGSISPSGTVIVTSGGSQTFTITPNTGYHVAGVIVDSVSQGAITSYTFTNVQTSHMISATFAINTYTITPTAGSGGLVSPSATQTVNYGGSQAFTITPNSGYYISTVNVDGTNQGAITSYTFTNVTASHTIAATFTANPVITSSAGSHGTISPSGTTSVTYGGTQAYTITPGSGYYVASVLVDGSPIGSPTGSATGYTFTGVVASHTISATFAANPQITSSVTSGTGSISPSGTTSVAYGGSQTYTITPGSGYYVSGVLVDGSSVGSPTGSATGYTFTGVVAAHTIKATFTANPQITSSVTSGSGSISPSGSTSVAYGGSQAYTITPSTGYDLSSVTVDGGSQGAITGYTFNNVITAHSISAAFTLWGAPTVASISPTSGRHGTTVTITSITGTNFHDGATVRFSTSTGTQNAIYLTNVNVISSTQISGTLVIPSGQSVSTYYVRVTNTDTQTGISSSKIFSVLT